jgi:hypothetical protein
MKTNQHGKLEIAALIAILIALAFVGPSDFEDEVMQEDVYCEMTASGAWPEYDKSIKCDSHSLPNRGIEK